MRIKEMSQNILSGIKQLFVNTKGIIPNASSYLNIPTYDGQNQMTHPDVIMFPTQWNGYKYWMVMTPYPNYNQRYENPSIIGSNDGVHWEVPSGLANPIVPAPAQEKNYNNDPEIVYHDIHNELWLYYQEVNTIQNQIEVKLTKSTDGIHWDKPISLLNIPCYQWTSPSYIKQNNIFKAWTVNAGIEGRSAKSTIVEYRESTDGINWGEQQKVTLVHPEYIIWHLDVIYVPKYSEYWMVWAGYALKKKGISLFFAVSRDGLNWTAYQNPIVTPGKRGSWDDKRIYRSSLLYNDINDSLRIWYSASDRKRKWHIGYVECNYALLTK